MNELYKDEKIRIEHSDEFPEDHYLFIKDHEEDRSYLLARGILQDFARTPRGNLERKIQNFNSDIPYHLEIENISMDGLHVALCQAYTEQELDYHTNKKLIDPETVLRTVKEGTDVEASDYTK